MIDLNTALVAFSTDDSDTELQVQILNTDIGGDFPILAMVGEDLDDEENQTIVRFNSDGESRKGKYTLQNPSVDDETDETTASDGKVVLPLNLTFRVRHSRFGLGTVQKVRSQAGKSALVKFEDGRSRWCFDRKLTLAA